VAKLRMLSGADLVSILRGFGFERHSQKGSHLKLRRRLEDGSKQTLVIPLHSEMDKGTLMAIYRQSLRYLSESDLRRHFYTIEKPSAERAED